MTSTSITTDSIKFLQENGSGNPKIEHVIQYREWNLAGYLDTTIWNMTIVRAVKIGNLVSIYIDGAIPKTKLTQSQRVHLLTNIPSDLSPGDEQQWFCCPFSNLQTTFVYVVHISSSINVDVQTISIKSGEYQALRTTITYYSPV